MSHPKNIPIHASALAKELDEQECGILMNIMKKRTLTNNELLITEGQADDTLFILTEGQLAVISSVTSPDSILYTMVKGECAGTRAFVDGTPRKASLRAVGDATVYTLKPVEFETLLDDHPRIIYKVMRALFRITHSNLMRMNMESEQLSNYINKSGGRY